VEAANRRQPQETRRLGRSLGVSGTNRRFLRHYLEMVVAMLAGMAILGVASGVLFNLPNTTNVRLVEMAVAMTLPMAAWMRFRGHSWAACGEMALAMFVPAGASLLLLNAGLVENKMVLFTFEHTAMFVGMFVVMLWRREEYVGHEHVLPDEDVAVAVVPDGGTVEQR
jgi:hypothetical protein